MKLNKILTAIALGIMTCVLLQGSSQAYQGTPAGTTKQDTATNWIINVRKMENAGGGMGLQEIIDTTTGLATSESNNIDTHLLKNTEYGAAILLGASDYGKQGASIEARRMDNGATTGTRVQASTTGNKYGIYELGYGNMTADNTNAIYEWTAAGTSTFLPNIASRYVDRYTEEKIGKAGDATIEGSVDFSQWHTTGPNSVWVFGAKGFLRGHRGDGVFFRGSLGTTDYSTARAAVVCGVGL